MLTGTYETRDIKRIKQFQKKAEGNFNKEIRYANMMANTLNDVNKCIKRAEASIVVYGEWNEITSIFYKKAKKLGYKGSKPGDNKDNTFVDDKPSKNSFLMGHINVHKIGKVNLISGDHKNFNIYEKWDENSIVELWVKEQKGLVHIRNFFKLINADENPYTGKLSDIFKPKSKHESFNNLRKHLEFRLIFTKKNKPEHFFGNIKFVQYKNNFLQKGRCVFIGCTRLKNVKDLVYIMGEESNVYFRK